MRSADARAAQHPPVRVRAERDEDREDVRRIHLAAFGEGGRDEHARVVVRLVDDLRASLATDAGLSLVAEVERSVVGHAMFTTSWLDAPRQLVPVQVLSPVGVLPDRQRRGVGTALIRRGLEILADRSVPLVFLEGAPEYYRRFGFEAGTEQGFRRPSLRIPEAGFQAVKLPAYEPWMTGTLVYSETFWRHDLVGLRDTDA